MELIEVLTLINLGGTFLCFLVTIYLMGKTFLLDMKIKSMKSPDEIIQKILETKMPVLMSPDGTPIMPGNIPPKVENPLTG